MTDNEIIKALKCCNKPIGENSCTECAFYHSGKCSSNMLNAALDLIKRQKAEIERLNIELQAMRSAANSYKKHYETAKSEAIKEFAEKLKEYSFLDNLSLDGKETVYVDDIDNLVEEMMEELKNDDTKNNISTFDGNRSIR